MDDDSDSALRFLYRTAAERDPKKRQVKPVKQLDLNYILEDSSDDSDFCVDDLEGSEDFDSSCTDEGEEEDQGGDDLKGTAADSLSIKHQQQEESSDTSSENEPLVHNSLPEAQALICSFCLGDDSDDTNEIVQCDICGVSVHEDCYGVKDSDSASSDSASENPLEPWFCEPCIAGVSDPQCELCPNSGGIFKETVTGRWVHLVCAMYVPEVSFSDLDKLSGVSLFEMPYSQWGAKTCSFCSDARFARTGVCISCDAAMCRTSFHPTCAQREGLLTDPYLKETEEQEDPYYGHCKMHVKKVLMRHDFRKLKRNWLNLQLQVKKYKLEQENPTDGDENYWAINHELQKQREKYIQEKALKPPPDVPKQKMPRMLTTSASACKKLLHKAKLMDIDTKALEIQMKQVDAARNVKNKWHVPAAFSMEFVGYYLDRQTRMTSLKQKKEELLKENSRLQKEEHILRLKYDQLMQQQSICGDSEKKTKDVTQKYLTLMKLFAPNKKFHALEELMSSNPSLNETFCEPETSLRTRKAVSSPEFLLHQCTTCHENHDQHLLLNCDTCQKYYHLGCLSPPLTRMPKKSKVMGWECSECIITSATKPESVMDNESTRKLRQKTKTPSKVLCSCSQIAEEPSVPMTSERKGKKRPRMEQKSEVLDSTVQSELEVVSTKSNGSKENKKPQPDRKRDVRTCCDDCQGPGSNNNLVRCDKCRRCFHFACLDPPVKKCPKAAGYSWHCAECDQN